MIKKFISFFKTKYFGIIPPKTSAGSCGLMIDNSTDDVVEIWVRKTPNKREVKPPLPLSVH